MDGQIVERLSASTNPVNGDVAWSRSFTLLIVVAAIAYGWLVYAFVSPYAGGSDSSSYLNFARSLTEGSLLAPVRRLPGFSVTEFGVGMYQPQGFKIRDNIDMMSPTYAVGFPMHIALASFLMGSDNSVALTNVLLALAGLALMYASCRYLKLSHTWSVGATVALGVCPYFINSALQPMSDLPAMTWALATLYAAMRSRERTSWAILCGAAASMALLVRPSNLLLTLPVLVAFGLSFSRYALSLVGALPGVLFAMYVNWRLYGTLPFWQTTGYGSPTQILDLFNADATQPFSIAYFRHHASRFVLWMLAYIGPLVLCGLALPFFPRGRTREYAIHAVWFIVLFLPYTVYQPAGDAWWYLRFLLPAFPSLILLATAGLSMSWDYFASTTNGRCRPRALNRAAAVTIILLSVGWMGTATQRLPLFDQRSGEKIYPDAALWARDHVPGNSIVICSGFSGAIYYYTDLPIVRWDEFAADKAKAFLDAASAQNRPLYAILWPYEVDDALRRMGGNWSKVAELGRQRISVLQSSP